MNTELDAEIAAMGIAWKALNPLDELAQQRAVQWLAARFASEAYAKAKQSQTEVAP